MTLVVALKTTGSIVLASDSRGTIGDPRGLTAINDTQKKLYPLGKCGLGFSGASEVGASLLDELIKEGLDDDTKQVDELVSQMGTKCRNLYSQWFPGMEFDKRPAVLFTVVGYRQVKPRPEVVYPMIYLLTSSLDFGPQLMSHQSLIGVPQYAVYLMHRYYDTSISEEKGKALAEYLISETACQDPKVGGPVRMALIGPVGYSEIDDTEIAAISDSNNDLNEQLRKFFTEGNVA